MNNDSNFVTQVEYDAPMKDGTSTVLHIEKTREYVRHMRYWRVECSERLFHIVKHSLGIER